jgi:cation transport regulator ChaC
MKKLLPLLTLGLFLSFGAAQADEKKAPTPQQQRMAQCNKDATGKSGDERKAFMSECLKAKPAAATAKGTAQQERMKKCNADASGKTGDERKKFMSQCLSNK